MCGSIHVMRISLIYLAFIFTLHILNPISGTGRVESCEFVACAFERDLAFIEQSMSSISTEVERVTWRLFFFFFFLFVRKLIWFMKEGIDDFWEYNWKNNATLFSGCFIRFFILCIFLCISRMHNVLLPTWHRNICVINTSNTSAKQENDTWNAIFSVVKFSKTMDQALNHYCNMTDPIK